MPTQGLFLAALPLWQAGYQTIDLLRANRHRPASRFAGIVSPITLIEGGATPTNCRGLQRPNSRSLQAN